MLTNFDYGEEAQPKVVKKTHFTKVDHEWFTDPKYCFLFSPAATLYLYLRYRWRKTKGVKLTGMEVSALGLSARTRQKALKALAERGLVRIERTGPKSAPTVYAPDGSL